MGSSQVLHERPTVVGPAAVVPALNPAFDGAPEYRVKPAVGGSGDKYRSNLMLAVMSHFHPGTHVQQELGPYAHVPVHVQKMLMLAFADAIEQNATQTPQLEEALLELFTEADQHVPFCALPASTDFTMMPRIAADLHQFNGLLSREVRWDQVPIAHGESFRPVAEQQAERDARLLHDLVWDPYEEEFSSYAGGPASILMEGPRLQQMHPMRSFSPLSIARGANAAAGAQRSRAAPARLYDDLAQAAAGASAFCRDPVNWTVFYQHVLLVWLGRFFRASTRFVDNGAGMMALHESEATEGVPGTEARYLSNGMHLMHGPRLPEVGEDPSKKSTAVAPCDIVVLRPNIEHEMLGVIMGRGGTQELGATFWGQTELSCYDDSQHGIWGMSYKYHERAMVTNERNMIRVYDVAFDGYNGGLDQTCVDWNDANSRKQFRDGTYDRSKPYCGPSMLVMALPVSGSRQAWPNPIVFHSDIASNFSADPEKSQGALPNLHEHMVFNHTQNPRLCSPAAQDRFAQYMVRLEMSQWATVDQSSQPAGESCVANESTGTPMAFQGSMRVVQNGQLVEDIKGSGHLGHSYVGIASVREGRGVLNPAAQHSTMRLV